MGESKKARRKRKTKHKKDVKRRNPYALIAKMRNSAGPQGRGRPDKEESRTACRAKVHPEDHMEDANEEM